MLCGRKSASYRNRWSLTLRQQLGTVLLLPTWTSDSSPGETVLAHVCFTEYEIILNNSYMSFMQKENKVFITDYINYV